MGDLCREVVEMGAIESNTPEALSLGGADRIGLPW